MLDQKSLNAADKNACLPVVVMVGAFPPPMHGMAAINSVVRDRFSAEGVTPIAIDISANSLNRSLRSRLVRLPKVLRGLARVAVSTSLNRAVLYMSVSGGIGQLYDVLFLCLARLRKMRIYLHHHSFAYLNRKKYITMVLVRVAGRSCTHIALSQGMAERLSKIYPSAIRCIAISNAALISSGYSWFRVDRYKINSIGFISNISEEKGIFEYLDLIEACEKSGVAVKAKIAGPFQDKDIEYLVRRRLKNLKCVEYHGPVYGPEKELFYKNIDVLVFPTKYANEAEPLTLHEAMRRNVPVIAYGRGCIPEMEIPNCFYVIDPENNFLIEALPIIKMWWRSPEIYHLASRAAGENAFLMLIKNVQRWNRLLGEILGKNVDALCSVEKMERTASKA